MEQEVSGVLRAKLFERFPSVTAAFLALDHSGRGALAIDAFADGIYAFTPGLGLQPEQVKQLLRAYDANRDGRVTFAEFAAALDGGLTTTKARTAAPTLATPPRTATGGAYAERPAAGMPRGTLAQPPRSRPHGQERIPPTAEHTPERSQDIEAEPWTPPRWAAAEMPAAGKPRGALAAAQSGLRTPPRTSSAGSVQPPGRLELQQRTPPHSPPIAASLAPAQMPVRVLAPALVLCRFPAASAIPQWATSAPFFSVTRAGDELSLLVPESSVPSAGLPYGVQVERSWRALRVGEAPLDFDLVGVLAAISGTLAAAQVPVLALSTFESDYVCVRDADVHAATQALSRAGHRVLMDSAVD